MSYVGRFAPSPTGPLHLGSLATAVASYVHAKQHGGRWLVRIEDIDPPRESPGAAAHILHTLEAFDLPWDGAVLYQSMRAAAYRDAVGQLLRAGLAFRCTCSRRELRSAPQGAKSSTSRYPGTCRKRGEIPESDEAATRVLVEPGVDRFEDGLQGPRCCDLSAASGDYVIVRRDGLPAYHLAAVIDDAAQGVTHVVRGVDLLESTFAHRHLQRALGLPAPRYFHLPVIVNALGQKLSKQARAAPVEASEAPATAGRVLRHLGGEPPDELAGAPPRELWQWMIGAWRIEHLRGRARIREAGA